jgi:hypothetical protein
LCHLAYKLFETSEQTDQTAFVHIGHFAVDMVSMCK